MFREAAAMLARSISVRTHGFKRYSGDGEDICHQIIRDCWNGTFFQTSTGHFSQFWMRDFGMQVPSLLKLGWKTETQQSLLYALEEFSKAGRVGTTITKGCVWDFPVYAPDSLAFLLLSLRLAKVNVTLHQAFLSRAVSEFFLRVIDPTTGLVRRRTHFSSIKDHYIRDGSCYDTVMAAVVAREARFLELDANFSFPLKQVLNEYWTGMYFLDDLSGSEHIAGDANTFPFWTGIERSEKRLKASLHAISQSELTTPFPLKYTAHRVQQPRIWQSVLAPNYEGNTIWTHIAGVYQSVLTTRDKKAGRVCRELLLSQIEKNGTVLEVFNPEGTPYLTPFYVTDEGMLWAASVVRPAVVKKS